MTSRDRSPSSSDAADDPSVRGSHGSEDVASEASEASDSSGTGAASSSEAPSRTVPSRSGERATRAASTSSSGDAPTETSMHAGMGSISLEALRAANQNELRALPVRKRARYQLLGEHARGGLGKILKARDKDLGRDLAIKEMREPDSASAARFVREALITARLEHPSIVPVHEAGRWENGEPFYAMKLVSGRTLKEVVQQAKGLTARLALLPSVIAVVDAIAYAHDQGVIHRDLKAANVIVGAFGETVVIDWGLAKDLHRPDDLLAEGQSPYRVNAEYTIAGAVVGTPAFMPPEQARGDDVDARADVYALGALLYYTLSGKAPHDGASSADILARARSEPPRPLAEAAPGVPRDLAAIVAKAMASSRDDRYQTAQALAGDLKRFQTGQLVSAHQYSLAQRALRWVRKHRGVTALSALFVVVAAMGAALYVLSEQRLRREAEGQRDRADQQTLSLLEQQGRSELAAGRPFRAAVYLTEALARKPESLALRGLVTQAVRPMATWQFDLVGHTRDVTSATYSPDGRFILTTSWDETGRIWESDSGRLVRTLPLAQQPEHAAWSPDGKLIATEAADRKLRIFEAETGKLLRTAEGRRMYRLWFTADSKRVLVGDSYDSLHVYDLDRGEWVFDVVAHEDRLQSGVVSPDGKTLYVGSLDGTVSVWDLATLTLRLRITDHDAGVNSVALSQDGRWLLTAEDQQFVHVRHADSGERVLTLVLPEEARATTASFSPDGRTIYTRSHDGVVRTYDARSGALMGSVDVLPVGKIFASAVRPDGRQMITVGISGSARVWRLGDAAEYRLLDTGDGVDVMPSVFSGDGRRIVTGDFQGGVRVFETSSGALLSAFQVPGNVHSLASNADGSLILSGGDVPASMPPGLWETTMGTRLADLTGNTPGRLVFNVAISADGTTFASASYDGQLRLFDVDDMKPQQSLKLEDTLRLTAVTFRNDGRELAVTNSAGVLYLVDRARNQVTRKIQAHPTWIQDVVYSPDGRRLLTCGRQDQTAKVWDVASGEQQISMTQQAQIMRGSWSPDGRFVATAGGDRTAVIWDATTGEAVRTIRGPGYTAEFSPDGRELLTTGVRGYAVLWDTSLDERSPRELSAFVAERSPWKLTGGRLELRTDPTAPAR